ncbi:MAG TPA: hypothetical protein VJK90_06395 [Acetobacteraceae bacterium]|jgi:hypothetical protein|nr:hypothetical protein [Acetobacteraceae bacterium]
MDETLDDVRLRAEEAQMRHALGLDGQMQAPRPDEQPPPPGAGHDRLSLHRPPRRFVKDGEVPVTVVRRTHPTDGVASIAPATSNQLEAARQTIRSQAVATERAERALNDAQAAIRDLRTKLAHERMAKDEAFQTVRRLETERDAALSTLQTMRVDLATERVGREKLEQELRRAVDARQAAETAQQMPRRPRGRPRKVVAPIDPLAPPRKRGRPRKVVAVTTDVATPWPAAIPIDVPTDMTTDGPTDQPTVMTTSATTEPPAQPRKRGRPRKVQVVDQAALDLPTADAPGRVGRPRKVREPKPVKWWLKGWKSNLGPRV